MSTEDLDSIRQIVRDELNQLSLRLPYHLFPRIPTTTELNNLSKLDSKTRQELGLPIK